MTAESAESLTAEYAETPTPADRLRALADAARAARAVLGPAPEGDSDADPL